MENLSISSTITMIEIKHKLLQDIKDAWDIVGKNPEYHRHQQDLLRQNFPTLWRAVKNVSEFYKNNQQ